MQMWSLTSFLVYLAFILPCFSCNPARASVWTHLYLLAHAYRYQEMPTAPLPVRRTDTFIHDICDWKWNQRWGPEVPDIRVKITGLSVCLSVCACVNVRACERPCMYARIHTVFLITCNHTLGCWSLWTNNATSTYVDFISRYVSMSILTLKTLN